MSARLRVVRAGVGATIQDFGRHGLLRWGVTPAGPMDWAAFRTANLALGNELGAAAIEIGIGGLDVSCEAEPVFVAFAGGSFVWRRQGVSLPRAARVFLRPGEVLSARAGPSGTFAYLAVEGGIATSPEMGSRATHVRSGIGGLGGRMLRAGDVLPLGEESRAERKKDEAAIEAPWLESDSRAFRVVLGPQDDHFTADALDVFFGEMYTVTRRADRMAYRLDGPDVAHRSGHDIVSDGVALGAIQVAGDRKPMVLMADRQPTGGYPKLGHVARADIGRFAQLRPGDTCRFEAVSVAEALAALLRLEDEIGGTAEHLRPLRHEITGDRLLAVNLIGGFVDALGATTGD